MASRDEEGLPRSLWNWWKLRRHAASVDGEPWMDAAGLARYKEVLGESGQHYLEFGSGGSTRYAEGRVITLVSVESDVHYMRSVASHLKTDRAVMMHANIGITEKWGRPVFVKPTRSRVAKWKRYPQAPWSWFEQHNISPDVVLIDGRFRVACALEALLRIPGRFRLLVDDYVSRPHYHVIADFADLVALHGRMAEFVPPESQDRQRCEQALAAYYADYR